MFVKVDISKPTVVRNTLERVLNNETEGTKPMLPIMDTTRNKHHHAKENIAVHTIGTSLGYLELKYIHSFIDHIRENLSHKHKYVFTHRKYTSTSGMMFGQR